MREVFQLRAQDLFILSIKYLTESIDAKDKYTWGHSERVRLYSMKIAERLDMDEDSIFRTYLAAQLHDIGKAKIPEAILKKKGKFTAEEAIEMEKHVIYAQHILSRHPFLKEIAKIIKHHHERWNGSGYPDQLSKTEIPLISRIIAVCDSFDAMTTNRVYRRQKSSNEAMNEILENRGILFDPQIVDIFHELFSFGEIEYLKGLNFASTDEGTLWLKAIRIFKNAIKKVSTPQRAFKLELKILEVQNKMKRLSDSRKTIERIEKMSIKYKIAINDKFLNEMALYHYYKKEFDEVINISEMVLSNKDITPFEKARALRHLAMAYWKTMRKEAALVEMSYAEDIYKELAKKLLEEQGGSLEMGIKFFEIFDENYLLYEEISLNLAKLYDVLGRIDFDLGNFKRALEYYNKSIDLKNDLDDNYGLSISYGGRGKVYSLMSKFKKAEQDFLINYRLSKRLHLKNGVYLSYMERIKNFMLAQDFVNAKKVYHSL